MNLFKKVKCPYCGIEDQIVIQEQFEDKIILCDPDRGGCEKHFAVFARIEVKTEIRKIEGEETKKLPQDIYLDED